MNQKLEIKLDHPYAVIPTRATPGSAGLDIYTCEEGEIDPKDRKLIRTGIKIILPNGTFGRIASRSGLALNYDLDVCAGIIDSDFRGEIKVLLMNNGVDKYKFKVGDKIAQLIIQPYLQLEPVIAENFEQHSTERGDKGWGSTDLN